MDGLVGHAASVFMGFLAILKPIANRQTSRGLNAREPPAVEKRVARRALRTTFVITVVSFLAYAAGCGPRASVNNSSC